MLIDPRLWEFHPRNARAPYPYHDTLLVGHAGKVTVLIQAAKYTPSSHPIAQGPVTTPPPMFATGDHDIVGTPWGFVDPNYGTPQDTTPYPTVQAYEKAAIAGFAVVYRDDNGKLTPLPLGTFSEVPNACRNHDCYFATVPYDQSGAP